MASSNPTVPTVDQSAYLPVSVLTQLRERFLKFRATLLFWHSVGRIAGIAIYAAVGIGILIALDYLVGIGKWEVRLALGVALMILAVDAWSILRLWRFPPSFSELARCVKSGTTHERATLVATAMLLDRSSSKPAASREIDNALVYASRTLDTSNWSDTVSRSPPLTRTVIAIALIGLLTAALSSSTPFRFYGANVLNLAMGDPSEWTPELEFVSPPAVVPFGENLTLFVKSSNNDTRALSTAKLNVDGQFNNVIPLDKPSDGAAAFLIENVRSDLTVQATNSLRSKSKSIEIRCVEPIQVQSHEFTVTWPEHLNQSQFISSQPLLQVVSGSTVRLKIRLTQPVSAYHVSLLESSLLEAPDATTVTAPANLTKQPQESRTIEQVFPDLRENGAKSNASLPLVRKLRVIIAITDLNGATYKIPTALQIHVQQDAPPSLTLTSERTEVATGNSCTFTGTAEDDFGMREIFQVVRELPDAKVNTTPQEIRIPIQLGPKATEQSPLARFRFENTLLASDLNKILAVSKQAETWLVGTDSAGQTSHSNVVVIRRLTEQLKQEMLTSQASDIVSTLQGLIEDQTKATETADELLKESATLKDETVGRELTRLENIRQEISRQLSGDKESVRTKIAETLARMSANQPNSTEPIDSLRTALEAIDKKLVPDFQQLQPKLQQALNEPSVSTQQLESISQFEHQLLAEIESLQGILEKGLQSSSDTTGGLELIKRQRALLDTTLDSLTKGLLRRDLLDGLADEQQAIADKYRGQATPPEKESRKADILEEMAAAERALRLGQLPIAVEKQTTITNQLEQLHGTAEPKNAISDRGVEDATGTSAFDSLLSGWIKTQQELNIELEVFAQELNSDSAGLGNFGAKQQALAKEIQDHLASSTNPQYYHWTLSEVARLLTRVSASTIRRTVNSATLRDARMAENLLLALSKSTDQPSEKPDAANQSQSTGDDSPSENDALNKSFIRELKVIREIQEMLREQTESLRGKEQVSTELHAIESTQGALATRLRELITQIQGMQ